MKNTSDYNTQSLIKISVKDRNFPLWVMPRFSSYYLDKSYEPYTSDLILKYIKEGTHFVDIGSHYGYYSILVANKKRGIPIIAIEPSPHTFKILKKNIKENKANLISSHQIAISDKEGEVDFLITEASDSSGLYGHPAHQVIKKVKVNVKKADSLLIGKKISVIKIDTEGVETSVLNGLTETLKKNPEVKLIIEFNPRCLRNSGSTVREFFDKIDEVGFTPFIIDEENRHLIKVAKQKILSDGSLENYKTCNILCLRKRKVQNVIVFSHSGGYGGSERSLLELIDELEENGLVVHGVIPKWAKNDKLSEWFRGRTIDTRFIDYKWWCGNLTVSAKNINEFHDSMNNLMGSLQGLNEWDADAVITNTLTIPWGGIYAQISLKPHLWIIREFGNLDFGFDYLFGETESYNFINRTADYILTNSKATLDFFRRKIRKTTIDYVYAFIPTPDPDQKLITYKNDIPEKKYPRLIINGKIQQKKGQLDALKAIKILQEKGVKVELVMLGWADAKYLSEIESFIKEHQLHNIYICAPQENVFPFINSADVVMMTSDCEAFGRVTVEAMIMNKPVIGKKTGGTRELILDGINGYFYNPGDINDLAKKVELLIQNPKLAHKMGNEGNNLYKTLFSKNYYGGKIIRILESISKNNTIGSMMTKMAESIMGEKILTDQIKQLKKEMSQKISETNLIRQQKKDVENQLIQIYNSPGWKILVKTYRIRDTILPKNSLRRRFIKKLLKMMSKMFLRNKVDITINRKINIKSKKIAYIGHSYHVKTKSTRFLIDYLKQNYNVTEVLDDSWQGKPSPDLTFIDDSYLAVIFFQTIPGPELITNIKHDNIIYVPMYDMLGAAPLGFWQQYSNLKFLNFSKTLHDKLTNWGLESEYVQYFPKPLESTDKVNKPLRVFFWQRTNKIDINTVEKLLARTKAKIHIHKAVDPGHSFVEPNRDQQKKFDITYSDWFKTKEESIKKISECDIYIAPREYEGIGLSYLEAMSMGKAVVAPNNPTMNEYIVDGISGYLYDLNNPKAIDFKNINDIKENAFLLSQKLSSEWENEKQKIDKFIKK